MLGRTLFVAVAASSLALAAPVSLDKRAENIDLTVLQFALTLEHLENAFYKGAIEKLSEEEFLLAGYSPDYYNDLVHIAFDEQEHVVLLEGAIKAANATPNAACTYKFPYTTVAEFITLSSILEGVGTGAYLGAAPLITDGAYLTVAGSILAIEALHTSIQRAAISEVPMANSLYTPLDPTSAYTLAAMFITTCPSSNTALGFTAFPSLTYDNASCSDEEPLSSPAEIIKKRSRSSACSPPRVGQTIKFTASADVAAGSFLTFVSGLTVTSVAANINGTSISAKVPSGIEGQSYAFVTSSNITAFVDSAVKFGPAIVEVYPSKPELNDSIL